MGVEALNVSRLFDEARRTVPAYQKFLAAHVQDVEGGSSRDRNSIPLMDKGSYLHRYPLPELFPGRIGAVGHASSGSSGRPTYWFRGPKQKAIGATLYGRIIRDGFLLRDQPRTLVIVAFSMGVWVAGTYTMMAFDAIAESNPGLSVIAPGLEPDDICTILADVAPYFECVVLAGYPGFLDLLWERMDAQGVRVPPKMFLLTSGDKSTEDWRDRTVSRLGLQSPESIVSIYGSSDGGILGFESPLTIAIRRRAREDAELRNALFQDPRPTMPGLFQFDPAFIDFEEVNGELVFSADLDLPLVRYNIHDAGRVLSLEHVQEIVPRLDSELVRRWPFPFVTVSGRTDVAATMFGLKIYPEHIQAGVDDPDVRPLLSGTFSAFSSDRTDGSGEQLNLNVELAPSRDLLSEEEQRLVLNTIHRQLAASNIEYRKLCSALGEAATKPSLRFFKNGDLASPGSTGDSARATAFVCHRGRKPRMLR